MGRYTLELARYALGLRPPLTQMTRAEQEMVGRHAGGAVCVVEVGAYEGSTSRVLAEAMAPDGVIYLVDPWLPSVRLERWFGFSGPYWIARRTLRPFGERAVFVREESLAAAARLRPAARIDLLLIDARHDYDSVSADFKAWALLLAPRGVVALHDSRVSACRPEVPPTCGPVQLIREIGEGRWGDWRELAAVDSLTLLTPGDSRGA